jgi:hypothetical protein
MKLRVFHLARELDIDPKQVRELAAELGIPLPNSVLASLTPQDRDRIVQRWEQRRNRGRGGWAFERAHAAGPLSSCT